MTSVIVVEDDSGFLRAIERELRREGMHVQSTDSMEQALGWLQEAETDVLLADLCIRDVSGIDLLRRARELSPRTRAVLMSGYASGKDYETAVELGAVRVLIKPFSNDELVEAIRRAAECDTGFRGSFHGLGLIDLLQMFHYAKRSTVLVVTAGQGGKIFVDQGNMVHAEHGSIRGEAALKAMLSMPAGSLRTEAFSEPPERSIERGFQEVLLDSLRMLDEVESPPQLDEEGASPASLSSVPKSLAPTRFSVAPVTPHHSSSLPLRPKLLSSRFGNALRALPQRPLSLVSVGMRLSTGEVERLHGDVDPAYIKDAMCELLSSAQALSDNSPSGVVERMSHRAYVQITWDRGADTAYLIADSFEQVAEGAFLRACAQTFARKLLGIEP